MLESRPLPTSELNPEEVAGHSFPSARRGLDPDAVRRFLQEVASQIGAARGREAELRSALAAAEARAAAPELDEATLTAALGVETTKVLRAAHDAAREVVARAEARAAELTATADAILTERTSAAESEAERITGAARARSEALLDEARGECRAMITEAREARRRILADLAARRREVHLQIEQIRAAKDALVGIVEQAASSVEDVRERLRGSEEAARQAAESTDVPAFIDDVPIETLVAEALSAPLGAAALFDGEFAADEELAAPAALTVAADDEATPGVAVEPAGAPRAADVAALTGAPEPAAAAGAAAPAEEATEAAAAAPAALVEPGAEDAASAVAPLDEAESGAAAESTIDADVDDLAAGDRAALVDDEFPVTRAGVVDEGVVPVGDGGAPVPEDEADAADAESAGAESAGAESAGAESAGAEPAEGDAAGDSDALPAAEEPAGAEEGQTSAVDALFARIRASRAADVAEARAVLGADAAGGRPDTSGAGDANSPVGAEAAADPDGADETGSLGLSEEHGGVEDVVTAGAAERRDELVAVALAELERALKRELRSDQNEVLASARRLAPSEELSALLPGEETAARIAAALRGPLAAARAAGAAFTAERLGVQSTAPADDAVSAAGAAALAGEVIGHIRAQLSGALGPSVGTDELPRLIGAAYREWKGERVARLAGDFVTQAFAHGVLAESAAQAVSVTWSVDERVQPCAECDDNALAEAQAPGEAFPTGQPTPPVHPGCRCVLLPVPS